MKKHFLIYLFIVIGSGIFTEKSFAMDIETIENKCIAEVIKIKARKGVIVSSSGLVKTCRFLAVYWINNGEVAPESITPNYSQVTVNQMRENFSGKW